jgi:hypothetical protein
MLLILAVACAARVCPAEEPSLTRLVPSGGGRGTEVQVTAAGKFPDWPVQVACDHAGLQWEPQEEAGKFLVRIAADARPGVARVRFHGPQGATVLKPFVVGELPEVREQEDDKQTNDRPKQAHVLESLPVVFNGALDRPRDVDTIAFELQAGETLVASLLANQVLQSPVDASLQLLDESEFVVAQNLDFHGLDPRLVFTAPRTGRYYIRLFGFPAAPDSSISFSGNADYLYRLTLTTGPQAEYVLPLAVSGVSETTLEPQGEHVDGLPAATVTADAVAGQSAWSVSLPGGGRELVLPVQGYPVVTAESTSTRAAPKQLELPMSVSGCLAEPNTEHVFAFKAAAGSQWRLELLGRELGSPIDPLLLLLDAEGKVLQRQDDQGRGTADPQFDWKAPADGEYRVVVRDLYGHGSRLHYYRLCIEPQTPDFSASVTGELLKTSVGKPLAVEVTIERRYGYAEELQVVAENLPEGVRCAPAVSAGSGDSAKKVTLTLEADQLYQGPLHLRVLAGEAGPAKPVTAGSSSPALWLSVIAAQ